MRQTRSSGCGAQRPKATPRPSVSSGGCTSPARAFPRNEAEAASWYRRAADQGDPEAQWQLGRLYLSGQGVARNEAEAASWYRRAADQGDPEIQWQLGLKYWHGLGVPQDVVQAYLWLSLAAAHLPPGKPRDNAARACARAAQQMTPAQWARAHELLSQWQPRKAP